MSEAKKERVVPVRHPIYGMCVVLGVAVLILAIVEGVYYIQGSATVAAGWVLLLGLLAISVANYLISWDILYPAFMFSAVWSLAAAVYDFFPFEIDPISWTTVCIFLGGNLCFSLGCILGNRRWNNRPAWFTTRAENTQPRRLLLLYSIIAVPLVVYHAMRATGVYSISPTFFIALRQIVLARQSDFRNIFLDYAPTVSVSTAFILLIEEHNRWLVAAGVGVTIVLGLLTTGRPILLLLFIGWMMLALLRKPNRSIRAMAMRLTWMAVVIVLVLTLVTLLTKRETQTENLDNKSGLEVAWGMTATYIAGPLAGFDYVVRRPESFEGYQNSTFAEIIAPLSALGFPVNLPPKDDPFLRVPFLINVFTAYKNYYIDFGMIGCFIAFSFFGFISSYLFRAATRGNQMATFFSAYLFYAMLFTPFDDVYFATFTRYIYVTAFGLAYFFVSRRFRLKLMISRQGAQA